MIHNTLAAKMSAASAVHPQDTGCPGRGAARIAGVPLRLARRAVWLY
jgi:hypothetical protein